MAEAAALHWHTDVTEGARLKADTARAEAGNAAELAWQTKQVADFPATHAVARPALLQLRRRPSANSLGQNWHGPKRGYGVCCGQVAGAKQRALMAYYKSVAGNGPAKLPGGGGAVCILLDVVLLLLLVLLLVLSCSGG